MFGTRLFCDFLNIVRIFLFSLFPLFFFLFCLLFLLSPLLLYFLFFSVVSSHFLYLLCFISLSFKFPFHFNSSCVQRVKRIIRLLTRQVEGKTQNVWCSTALRIVGWYLFGRFFLSYYILTSILKRLINNNKTMHQIHFEIKYCFPHTIMIISALIETFMKSQEMHI